MNLTETFKDYHNLYTGGYDFGDIVFERLITVNQVTNMYWKKSKNPTDPSKARARQNLWLILVHLWPIITKQFFCFFM